MTSTKRDTTLSCYLVSTPDAMEENGLSLATQRLIERNVGETLTDLTDSGDARLNLLESSSVSFDGLTFRFTLKKGLKFHDGNELAADDVIASLERVLADKNSDSQLHLIVAEEAQGFSLKRISRHRLEFKLQQRTSDLLARLSLPELQIVQASSLAHCGAWRPQIDTNAKVVRLERFDDYFKPVSSPYRTVLIKALDAAEEFNQHVHEDSYVLLYPGHLRKTPALQAFASQHSFALDSGISIFCKLDLYHPKMQDIKEALLWAAKQAFASSRAYARWHVNGFFSERHTLHVERMERAPRTALQAKLRLRYDEAMIPGKALARFASFAEELGLTLSFGTQASSENFDGSLNAIYAEHPKDIYTPLRQLIPANKSRKSLLGGEAAKTLPQAAVRYMQDLVKDPSVIPLLYAPFIVMGNRGVDPSYSDVLRFHKVRAGDEVIRLEAHKEQALRAIGSAFQMLAHDIRKPFSMMQAVLNLLEAQSDPVECMKVFERYVPQVKRSIRAANQLVQDIVEIGSNAEPYMEVVSLRDLLKASIGDVCSLVSGGVKLREDYGHTRLVHVDRDKLMRVSTNILTNALQAMPSDGEVWIRTKDSGGGKEGPPFVTVCIGNSGSFIPEEERHGLFDRFFTRGKRKGTGLGLAIVKKIVTDHGGQVWCKSEQGVGTEFYFTVPGGDGHEKPKGRPAPAVMQRPITRHNQTKTSRVEDGSAKRVLIVDDEAVHFDYVSSLITNSSQKSSAVLFEFCADPEGVLEVVEKFRPQLVIVDVYFRGEKLGFHVVRRLRASGHACLICVHSSGEPFELQRQAVASGADLFLPKPMARQHLLALLERNDFHDREPDWDLREATTVLVIVDDDPIFLEAWQAESRSIRVYSDPYDLLQDYQRGAIASGSNIVFGFDYALNCDISGAELARRLRSLGCTKPIFLISDIGQLSDQDMQVFDGRLPKDPKAALLMLASEPHSLTLT